MFTVITMKFLKGTHKRLYYICFDKAENLVFHSPIGFYASSVGDHSQALVHSRQELYPSHTPKPFTFMAPNLKFSSD